MSAVPPRAIAWALLLVTVATMAWAGRHFYVRAWQAACHGAADMNTLIAFGTIAAFADSLVATAWPEVFVAAGVAPDVMGVGPIKAVPKALAKAGVSLDAIKVIEFNEAFAAQAGHCGDHRIEVGARDRAEHEDERDERADRGARVRQQLHRDIVSEVRRHDSRAHHCDDEEARAESFGH